MPKILLIDDEPSILSVLSTLLKAEDYDVQAVLGGENAAELIAGGGFDLMITDIRMSPINGMELLKQAHDQCPGMSVIMLTAYGSVETAIEALKLGAFDYVTKPFKVDELLITVQRAIDYNKAITENADLKAQLNTRYHLKSIVAESKSMQSVCDMIQRVAPTDATILIGGESGTGKELVAKAIHAYSRRKDKNFLAVNCAALPEPLLESEMFGHVKGAFTGASSDKEGLLEAASGGTIMLDEIASMPLSIQGKLLRVLQEKEVRRVGSNENIPIDARVLAATNTSLEKMIKEGTFREDLYYRLSVIPIDIPPLRERPEDIMPLVYHVMKRETMEGQALPVFDPEVTAILESYTWPGNVRELENTVTHAITFAREGKITKADLPAKVATTPLRSGPASLADDGDRGKSLKAFLRAKEKEYLQHVLSLSGGDKEEAAKTLKISLATLYRKLPENES
ncbi:MAG: sigma-54-dependent Fis family transcriptional regulator [Verrucomicrobia bacterium]|jgi:two-component system, NtrC family, response regulator PilR|nr:sigma-54-dependent Fis family transcriptional regulator [Verrucomicrobiota bacterium]MBT7064978.1 sigma-54-dependent Fis family transcriptional regulator [Verrucomicrobiota bacterium]MBT7700712.1 sigma-54-dependent Fis family transcriptional regulator [Verrucomicrobiota bacterium]